MRENLTSSPYRRDVSGYLPLPPASSRRLRPAPYIQNYPRKPRRSYRRRNFWIRSIFTVFGILCVSYAISLLIQSSYLQGKQKIDISTIFLPVDSQWFIILFLAFSAFMIFAFILSNRNFSFSMLLPRRLNYTREYIDDITEEDEYYMIPPRTTIRRSRQPVERGTLDDDLEDLPWDDVERLSRPASPTQLLEIVVAEKRQKFLNIPNISFQFANHEQIRDFYNVYFKEPAIESVISEISGEQSGNIKGSVPQFIEAQMQGTNANKWTSNIKVPTLSTNAMFLRYQKETIKREQVSLGIEEVDIELTELQAFEEAIENIKGRFGFEIDEANLSKQRSLLKDRAAEKTLSKLEQITGWVLVEGKFKIEKENDFYKCTYTHPVNNYLSNQAVCVTISVLVPANSLEEHIKGNYAQSIGKSIPLKVYGQVWLPIDRQTDVWELQLTPLAIY